MEFAQPYLLIQTGRSLGMADFVACQQFAYGYKNNSFHNAPVDEDISEKDRLTAVGNSLINMKRFMFEDAEGRITALPQIKGIKKFFGIRKHILR